MGRDYSRLHRILKLIHFISGRRGISIRDLVREFECSERNIYRDLKLINDIGIPCQHDPVAGGYVIRKGFFMPPIELTFEEALAVATLLDHVPRDGQIPFFSHARKAIHKIRSQLPEELKDELEPLDGHLRIDLARGTPEESVKDIYADVRNAIATRRVLHCRYDAVHSLRDDDDALFELRPYTLWYCQRGWYVVGHHGGRNEVRLLKLNRFDYAQPTAKPYAIPDDFDLRTYLGQAWRMIGGARHHVAVCFEPAFAENARETRWHPTQREQPHSDGSITLHFDIDGLDEICWWALGYGPGARVVEPLELANKVRDLALATARRYAGQ